jgi:3-carboxy-cis,cis-muconate cycloisomerase
MTDAPLYGSPLLSPIFASEAIRRLFSDRAILQSMLDFELALAEAEAEAGVIPADALPAIRSACDAGAYDVEAIGRAAALAGNVAIPLVKALTDKTARDARGCVHWGATSQDVIDTAFMLRAREASQTIRTDLKQASHALTQLIAAHRMTLMAGRTFMQQALPITFAYKAAVWLSGLSAAAGRLRRVEAEGLALQFGGAAGTLAALGDKGVEVRGRLAARLKLREPTISWHAERGRIADIAAALGALSGTCATIATDVMLLMQTEVGEASEPSAEGKGGSSTMPHKRNPIGAAAIRANHRRIAGLVASLCMSMEQEHERGAGGWSAEWESLRELFCLSAGSVERLRDMLAGLELDAARMRQNLDATLGLPLAESLMMALAPATGRGEAHHRVEAASKLALARGRPLAEIAKAEPAIAGHLSAADIDRALDPSRYLGSAEAMIDAALADARREMETD